MPASRSAHRLEDRHQDGIAAQERRVLSIRSEGVAMPRTSADGASRSQADGTINVNDVTTARWMKISFAASGCRYREWCVEVYDRDLRHRLSGNRREPWGSTKSSARGFDAGVCGKI